MHFKNIWGGGGGGAGPCCPYVLLVFSADKCHIHMCTIFFTFTSITESISSDARHLYSALAFSLCLSVCLCLSLSLSLRDTMYL